MQDTFTSSHRGGSGEPLVLLHGFLDTWRSWELVLGRLERAHDVLALTLPGHAGGRELTGPIDDDLLVDVLEDALDEAGIETAHVAGNSLGGFLALQLAARGRARSVVAFAPGGGWAAGDPAPARLLEQQRGTVRLLRRTAVHADRVAATPEGRRQALRQIAVNTEHVPAELVVHQMRGVAACSAADPLIDHALAWSWPLDAARIDCPLRIVWGTHDRMLPWPSSAVRYREWFPHADWVVLDEVGHSPQLDVPLEAAELILGHTRG